MIHVKVLTVVLFEGDDICITRNYSLTKCQIGSLLTTYDEIRMDRP